MSISPFQLRCFISYYDIILGVETNLPPYLKEEAVLCFEAAVANRMNIGDCIQKVENDVLNKCNDEFQGKRYKGFITFNYESNTISIQVSSLIL